MSDLTCPTEERWLPIVETDGRYAVSSHGRIRSNARRVVRRTGGAQLIRERIMSCAPGSGGYPIANLRVNGGRKTQRVHVLVLEAFVGPRPSPEHEGCHWDDNPANNYLGNLRWDTSAENSLDALRNGRFENALKTVCPRGHRLEGRNLINHRPAGRRPFRQCRACANARSALHQRGEPCHGQQFDALANDYYRKHASA